MTAKFNLNKITMLMLSLKLNRQNKRSLKLWTQL